MRLSFIFIYLSFTVSAKKHKANRTRSESESLEYFALPSTLLDFRGNVRKLFALEAALLDHARNMVCSPLSVLMPLGKLTLGSKEKSQKELLRALGLDSRKQIENAFSNLISSMEYLPGVHLDVASRLYINAKHEVNHKFMRRTKRIFKSSCEIISAGDPVAAARSINDWVYQKTRQKINGIIRPADITRDTSMILVNAIYFAGTWENKFRRSYQGDFHSPAGKRRIPMMSRQGEYNYRKCDILNAQIIEIPYKGGECSMIIVLPYSDSGLSILLRALKRDPELLNDALEKMRSSNVILSMPKFKIESEFDLRSIFKKLGVRTIFDPDTSGLTRIIDDETVYVTKAIHKAIIEVDETGTEAAAATGIQVSAVSAILNQPIFHANRPFMFYITFSREQLFAGVFSG